MKKVFLICCLVLILIGCAGKNFTWEQAKQIKVGMSEAELIALMGEPSLVRTQPDGILYVWSYADTFNGAKSIAIPLKEHIVTSVPPIPFSN